MSSILKELIDKFAQEGRSNLHRNLSILWICYKGLNPKPASGFGGSWSPNKLVYPASVVKLFYACAVEAWLHRDLLVDSLELRRAQADMIQDSSNDATSYIIDMLTGTTSGPSLEGPRWECWKQQRNLINDWLNSLQCSEFESINCSQKTFSDGPYGRDKDFYGEKNKNRNALSVLATAKMLEVIMTNDLLPFKSSKRLRDLLLRSLEIGKRKLDPENQIDGFLGEGLPKETKLWSKAGLMSEARHDAAWFHTPKGNTMLLVVFCEGKILAKDEKFLPILSRELVAWNFENA